MWCNWLKFKSDFILKVLWGCSPDTPSWTIWSELSNRINEKLTDVIRTEVCRDKRFFIRYYTTFSQEIPFFLIWFLPEFIFVIYFLITFNNTVASISQTHKSSFILRSFIFFIIFFVEFVTQGEWCLRILTFTWGANFSERSIIIVEKKLNFWV